MGLLIVSILYFVIISGLLSVIAFLNILSIIGFVLMGKELKNRITF